MLYNLTMTIAIFSAKLLELSLSSIRLIFTVKQEKFKAACIAFIECLVWCFVISGIINSLSQNTYWLLAYSLGYASGVYTGSIIEKKLALGNRSIQFISSLKDKDAIINYLKENNHGYTIILGEGATEERVIILTIVKRRDVIKVTKDVEKLCQHQIFSITSDVSNVYGGFGLRK